VDTSADKAKPEQSSSAHAGRMALRRALRGTARRVLHPSDARIIESFPMFSPASAGSARDLAELAIQAADQVFPFLLRIASPNRRDTSAPVPITCFANDTSKKLAAAELKELYDHYGSDKAGNHDYHLVYGSLLSDRMSVTALLEIGLGTNNPRLVSNMGKRGRPGGSLRAFRDFLPKAQVYGADIDRQILFEEDRITTFFVDQTDPASLTALADLIGNHFDLIIDDGLHSPAANLAVLDFGLGKLKIGGWLVVEDIRAEALPIWQLTAAIMPRQFEARVVTARKAALFVVQRLA
jgi:cephalosporin hydroxylase